MMTPANDPFVIAVGAAEVTDWGVTIPSWSGNGEWSTNGTKVKKNGTTTGYTGRTPDVIAPGVSIESLRVPNSRIDIEHPSAVVNTELLRGSGSSQATAVVSGAAALLLDARPDMTPDQVKAALMATAHPVQGFSVVFQGAGVIDVQAALAAPPTAVVQNHPRSSGLGSIEASRGTQHIVVDGVTIKGEVTAWGGAWDGAAVIANAQQRASWTGASWTGASWTGASWTGASWTGASWTGASWTGASWTGASWTGASWTGASWTGASWTGASWTGASWTGASWTGASWTGASWTGTGWC